MGETPYLVSGSRGQHWGIPTCSLLDMIERPCYLKFKVVGHGTAGTVPMACTGHLQG